MRMKPLSSLTLVVAVLVSLSPFAAQSAPQKAAAASAPTKLRIDWLGQSSVVSARSPAEASAALAELAARTGRRHVVVQFTRALSGSERALSKGAGLELLAYLGNHA